MIVTFISQCEKNALKKTRRILDAFGNRIGHSTWQTTITEQGLAMVKELLKQSASRSTAVSCHRVTARKLTKLVWIVGNKRKFNELGYVAVNWTSDNKQIAERYHLNSHVISLLASLAGFFHDIGKANMLFQSKLHGNSEKLYESYRHEWISLRLFQAFVNGKNDKEWLTDLAKINNNTEQLVLSHIVDYRDGLTNDIKQPFEELPPVAQTVAWLILSHHKLPCFPNKEGFPAFDKIDEWITKMLEPSWNSPQCLDDNWTKEQIKKNWQFELGTPFKSAHWQTHVSLLAKRTLQDNRIFMQPWLHQQYTAHISRLCLILADHHYSSSIKITPEWQDRNYDAYANTYKDDNGEMQLKQKLDEHNIAVGIFAKKIARNLPTLYAELPSLSPNSFLASNTKNEAFEWQNKAYEKARNIQDDVKKHGFFGICTASTGKGKTLANARIMYGLSESGSCRFNIALGLRTLTLQTADALEEKLELEEGELAMLVGSQAVIDLHHHNGSINQQEENGSGSSESLIDDNLDIIKGTNEYEGEFKKWIEHDPKILKLLQSPILVSTIDYLMPASEGVRGGRQIAPMLRLLTSDLVLDEPDDFGLDDLPALCRLVNWAGMLGSKVLISTATMPPSLATALFLAYQSGRKQFTEVNGEMGINDTVCCAWFDEFKKPQNALVNSEKSYEAKHNSFINKRISNLAEKDLQLQKGKLVDIEGNQESDTLNTNRIPSDIFAFTIKEQIHELHENNHMQVADKKVSIGLVRMANINPLVQVTKSLLLYKPADDMIIHYCIYHSRFPLVQRSAIEKQLDNALTRKNEAEWLENSNIRETINGYSEKNHIFVVVATSVAEVGRDHDYDWAVIEPSSMRSIIQLAGRIQRHRKIPPKSENIHILATNYKGLIGEKPNFVRPGFEIFSKKGSIQYSSHDLHDLQVEDVIKTINATPRISQPCLSPPPITKDTPPKITSFIVLEHVSQKSRLFGSASNIDYAALWWKNNVHWCGEMQRRQPFRNSAPDKDYCLMPTYHGSTFIWQEKVPKSYPTKYLPTNDIRKKSDNITITYGNTFWCSVNIDEEMESLQIDLASDIKQLFKKFTLVSLTKLSDNTDEQWLWHSNLGIYKGLKNDKK